MKEQLTDRQRRQIAEIVQRQLLAMRVSRFRDVLDRLEYLSGELGRVNSLRRRLGLAVGRCWYAAAEQTAASAHRALHEVPYCLTELHASAERCQVKLSSQRDILADLRQLETEFGGAKYDPQRQTLSVTTEAIELEDVYLGDFQIILQLARLGDRRAAYHVIALNPHPAGCNSLVTHPHVSDEHLCEGDAMAPIASALAQGRLCDFFLLVRSVLTTYNRYSPYVALEEWYGRSCHDCGSSVNDDDICHCQSCEQDFCDGCISYCRCCDDSYCLGCLQECPICEERTCSSCMTTCRECGQELCQTCREGESCPCHEENDDEIQETAAAGGAGEKQ